MRGNATKTGKILTADLFTFVSLKQIVSEKKTPVSTILNDLIVSRFKNTKGVCPLIAYYVTEFETLCCGLIVWQSHVLPLIGSTSNTRQIKMFYSIQSY